MRQRTRSWLVRAGVVAGVVGFVALGWAQRDPGPVLAGMEARDFTAPTLAGDSLSLGALRGSVVLLNFWATWCAPCVVEMPSMEQVHRELGPRGLEIVAVSLDAAPGGVDDMGRSGGDVAAFVSRLGLTFPVVLDPGQGIKRQYGVYGLPTTLLIDRQGVVRRVIVGARDWTDSAAGEMLRDLIDGAE